MNILPATDVVVIGGGVIGCAAAYELARAGTSVSLVEYGEIATYASGASAGGVRQQGRDSRELPIALRAIARWPQLTEELNAELDYRQDGHLTLVEHEKDLPLVEQRVRAEQERGLGIEVVYGDDLRQLVPDVAPDILAGAWCPTDGHAMPVLVTKAYGQAAERAGATIYQRTAVTGIRLAGSRVVAVETSTGEIACHHVVLAAGAWSAELARMVGITLPMYTHIPQMMVTSPMPLRLKPVMGCVGRRLSLKQLPNGAYLLGGGWPGTVDKNARVGQNLPLSMVGSAVDASAVYPPLLETTILRAWVGLEATATDGVPILGLTPSVEGLLLATAFSGHGFALAPEIGRLMAALVTTGTTPYPIDDLSLARFDTMATIQQSSGQASAASQMPYGA